MRFVEQRPPPWAEHPLQLQYGGTPIAIAVLCTTVQHSVTHFSHSPEQRWLIILRISVIRYSGISNIEWSHEP
jgi:hypothetical protein